MFHRNVDNYVQDYKALHPARHHSFFCLPLSKPENETSALCPKVSDIIIPYKTIFRTCLPLLFCRFVQSVIQYIFDPYFLGHSLHWLVHRSNGWYRLYVTMGNGSLLGVKQLGCVLTSHSHRAQMLKKEWSYMSVLPLYLQGTL